MYTEGHGHLPGKSCVEGRLPGKSCGPRTESRGLPGSSVLTHRHRAAYPAAAHPAALPETYPATAPTPIPGRGPTRQITTRVWRLPRAGRTRRTYPANHDACAPGGPTRQITRPTRQVRISEGVLGQACKTCLTVGSEHGEASGLC